MLTKQAVLVANGLIKSGNLLGRVGYIGLTILENTFVAFMLIVNSQPTYNLGPQGATTSQGRDASDGYVLDSISTADVHIFNMNSPSGQGGDLIMADLTV